MKILPLEPKDFSALKPYFEKQKYSLCSYSLPSAIAWSNKEVKPHYAIIDDAVLLTCEFTTRTENRHMMLPVSLSGEYNPTQLRELASEAGYDAFWFIPESYIDTFGRDEIEHYFQIQEQPGYHDYVYLTEDMINLSGRKYSKKRNLIRQFKKHYLNNGNIQVEPIDPSVSDECVDFMERWCEERDCDMDDDPDLACEKQAVINTLAYMDRMETQGLLVRVDGELSAFGMVSRLKPDMGVLHFEKAFARIKGLYQYLDNLIAARLLEPYRYINKENDINIPGLVKSKRSYHPVAMVTSHKLIVKTQ
jgi:uncharacterized protein